MLSNCSQPAIKKHIPEPVNFATLYQGGYKPGQLLPNGLITLDYFGVNNPSRKNFNVQVIPPVQHVPIMDPMVQAFRQFIDTKQQPPPQQQPAYPGQQMQGRNNAPQALPPNPVLQMNPLLQQQQGGNPMINQLLQQQQNKQLQLSNLTTMQLVAQQQQAQQLQVQQLLLANGGFAGTAATTIGSNNDQKLNPTSQQQQLGGTSTLNGQMLAKQQLEQPKQQPTVQRAEGGKPSLEEQMKKMIADSKKEQRVMQERIEELQQQNADSATKLTSAKTVTVAQNENNVSAAKTTQALKDEIVKNELAALTAAANSFNPSLSTTSTILEQSGQLNNSSLEGLLRSNSTNNDILSQLVAARGGSLSNNVQGIQQQQQSNLGAGGGLTQDMALEILMRERAQKDAKQQQQSLQTSLSSLNNTNGGTNLSSLKELEKLLHPSLATNHQGLGGNLSLNQGSGDLAGVTGSGRLTDLIRGLSGRGLSEKSQPDTTQVKPKAAAGSEQLTDLIRGLSESLYGSGTTQVKTNAAAPPGGVGTTSLNSATSNTLVEAHLADYISQTNNAPILTTQESIAVSKMSDDEIKAMLEKLRNPSNDAPLPLVQPPKLSHNYTDNANNNISNMTTTELIRNLSQSIDLNSKLSTTDLIRNLSQKSLSDLVNTTDLIRGLSKDLAEQTPASSLLDTLIGSNETFTTSDDNLHQALQMQSLLGGGSNDNNLPLPSLTGGISMESTGLQQAIQDAMRYLDRHPLESSGSLGPTLLQPGLSEQLAELRANDEATEQAFWKQGGASSAFGDMQSHTEEMNDQMKMTSQQKRGVSGGSIDDLCRAAGLTLPDKPLELPKKRKKKKKKKKTSKIKTGLKPGKTDQSLMDDSDEDDDDKPLLFMSSKRKRSFGSLKGKHAAKRHSSTTFALPPIEKDTELQQNQFKSQADDGVPSQPQLNHTFSRVVHSMPTNIDRGHESLSLEIMEGKTALYRHHTFGSETENTTTLDRVHSQASSSTKITDEPADVTTDDLLH